MPMPNPLVLIAFLDAYPKVKQKQTEDSYLASATAAIYSAASFITDPEMAKQRKLADDFYRAKIPTAKSSVTEWLNIAIKLGEDARIEQYRKRSPGDSDLALIYHTMRSYIISCIRNDENARAQYDAEVRFHLTELNDGIKPPIPGASARPSLRRAYKTEFDQDVDCKSSIGAMVEKMWKLADLGYNEIFDELTLINPDKIAIEKNRLTFALPTAKEMGDLKNGKKNIPLCYQEDFYHLHYLNTISKLYPVPDELKTEWGIALDKKEYLWFGEFVEQFESSTETVRGDKLARDTASRRDRRTRAATDARSVSTTRSSHVSHPTKEVKETATPSPRPSQMNESEDSVASTIDPPPVKKHQSTPPKAPSLAFFSDDGQLYPAKRPPASAPQLMPREEDIEEKDEKQHEPSSSPSLGRSGEQ